MNDGELQAATSIDETRTILSSTIFFQLDVVYLLEGFEIYSILYNQQALKNVAYVLL